MFIWGLLKWPKHQHCPHTRYGLNCQGQGKALTDYCCIKWESHSVNWSSAERGVMFSYAICSFLPVVPLSTPKLAKLFWPEKKRLFAFRVYLSTGTILASSFQNRNKTNFWRDGFICGIKMIPSFQPSRRLPLRHHNGRLHPHGDKSQSPSKYFHKYQF